MDEISNKAFGSLGVFPIVQAAVALLIILGAVYLMIRANKDKNMNRPVESPYPPWVVEKVLDELRHIRLSNERVYEKMHETKQLIELIRNEYLNRPDRRG